VNAETADSTGEHREADRGGGTPGVSGRDLVGYGASPPNPRWPGGARLALSFVLNYEEGGERTPLEGDPESESYLHEVVGAQPTPGRDLNVESMFEFGSRAGFWRVHRIFTRHGLPLTVYAVGQALERNPAAARAMVDAGWEVASHGWRWIDYAAFSEEDERAHMRRAIDAIERVCGVRPVGWYTGRISESTRRLVVEDGGFLYDSDDYSDELPYWAEVGGRHHLVIPYTLDANDFKFLIPNGFATADDFRTYLVDSFEQLVEEGGRMMSVGLHCRIIGRPGRAPALDRFLAHVAARDDVWVTTRAEIARHWHARHPPGPAPALDSTEV
jgi:allantoinase